MFQRFSGTLNDLKDTLINEKLLKLKVFNCKQETRRDLTKFVKLNETIRTQQTVSDLKKINLNTFNHSTNRLPAWQTLIQ